jgi:hypothetical protein
MIFFSIWKHFFWRWRIKHVSQEVMRNDYENLAIACCSPEAPVTISRAPKPNILPKTDISVSPKEEMETFLL